MRMWKPIVVYSCLITFGIGTSSLTFAENGTQSQPTTSEKTSVDNSIPVLPSLQPFTPEEEPLAQIFRHHARRRDNEKTNQSLAGGAGFLMLGTLAGIVNIDQSKAKLRSYRSWGVAGSSAMGSLLMAWPFLFDKTPMTFNDRLKEFEKTSEFAELAEYLQDEHKAKRFLRDAYAGMPFEKLATNYLSGKEQTAALKMAFDNRAKIAALLEKYDLTPEHRQELINEILCDRIFFLTLMNSMYEEKDFMGFNRNWIKRRVQRTTDKYIQDLETAGILKKKMIPLASEGKMHAKSSASAGSAPNDLATHAAAAPRKKSRWSWGR